MRPDGQPKVRMFKLTWRLGSRPERRNANNKISLETIELVRTRAEGKRFWGAEKIRGELLELGIRVAKRAIQRHRRAA